MTGKRECTFFGGEVRSYTLDQLTNYALTKQPTVIEDPSSDEEYVNGGSRSKSEDEACPKSTVVEEDMTVEECPTDEAHTEKYNND